MASPTPQHPSPRGQSLVEFALIAPLLVALIVGIIELGILFSVYVGLTNSAREGARAGAIYQAGRTPTNGDAAAVAAIDAARRAYLISVAPSATGGRSYYVRFPISYGGKTHWLWYYLAIKPPTSNSNSLNQYVYSLGYANFVITDIRSNVIRGRAVSGLLRPGDVIAGMQPRLVPWEE